MLAVTVLIIVGISLLALGSNKHFKRVGSLFGRQFSRSRKRYVQNSMRIGGWLLMMLSFVEIVNTPEPLAISLVWWFALIAVAILLVAVLINQKSP
ncbi:DUF3325 family protein [Alteromonas sp. CI.11.F.A3]|uniref:DUF3325 family protein n=1 Tax=Alteromonas sp. CI.11.F.A3 TaxID=3079555 RepID=UPI0029425A1E|nr:DUF3325 family protein [Alteromonas sp. CI.11.F.A3]WOI39311.1 DUF3325 family protein [Alteromonas sp. CI.11.F.A3]